MLIVPARINASFFPRSTPVREVQMTRISALPSVFGAVL